MHSFPNPCIHFSAGSGIQANHSSDVIMSMMASQITSLTIVYSTVHSGADQRKHQSFASLPFVRGIHRWLVNSPHKGPVTRKMFPFDDVFMHLMLIIYSKLLGTEYHMPVHVYIILRCEIFNVFNGNLYGFWMKHSPYFITADYYFMWDSFIAMYHVSHTQQHKYLNKQWTVSQESLRPGQNGQYFADNTCRFIFLNKRFNI